MPAAPRAVAGAWPRPLRRRRSLRPKPPYERNVPAGRSYHHRSDISERPGPARARSGPARPLRAGTPGQRSGMQSDSGSELAPMPTAVIIDAVRTPVGRRGGRLSGWHATDLAAQPLAALLARNDLDPALVEDV